MDETAAAIVRALSQPPCRAGLRLRPEEELAALLRLTYRQTREVLSELERQGLVARRRGSGTYVRRVPHVTEEPGDEAPDWLRSLGPGDLLVPAEAESRHARKREMSLRPHSNQRRLHLELWGDLHCTSNFNQLVLAGLTQRAGRLGHQITIHSLVDRRDIPLPSEELRRQLQESHADGYVVVDRWADLFLEALGEHKTPAVFFRGGAGLIRHEPMVLVDTVEAVERGVGLLAEAGHRNIALLDIEDADHPSELLRETYERALEKANLDYQAVETARPQLNSAMRAFRRLLARDPRPDAVYVADDNLMAGVAEVLALNGLRAGVDLGFITLSNVGVPLPEGVEWSRLEVSPEVVGVRLVDELVRRLEQADVEISTISIHASWRPGKTHLSQRSRSGGGERTVAVELAGETK